MKRLAARDFEDLLQVCGEALEDQLSSNVFIICSAQSQYLRASLKANTIAS
jgi:hypothetical protein